MGAAWQLSWLPAGAIHVLEVPQRESHHTWPQANLNVSFVDFKIKFRREYKNETVSC
jgi:hypothetical protein